MNGISTYCANGDHFLLCHIKLKEQTVEAKKYSLKKSKTISNKKVYIDTSTDSNCKLQSNNTDTY